MQDTVLQERVSAPVLMKKIPVRRPTEIIFMKDSIPAPPIAREDLPPPFPQESHIESFDVMDVPPSLVPRST